MPMAYPRPALPQELIDHIVDDLVLIDRKSLLACAAAARTFTDRARSYTFMNIEIREGDVKETWPRDTLKIEKIKKLRQVLEENTHLGQSIRSFAIEGTALGTYCDSDRWLLANQDLPYIFQHLSALRAFAWRNSIGYFSWRDLNTDIVGSFKNLGHDAPNLISLEFKGIADFPFDLLFSFPNLKELRFRYMPSISVAGNKYPRLPSTFAVEGQDGIVPEPRQDPLPFFLDSATFVKADPILKLLVKDSLTSPQSIGALSRLQSLTTEASDITPSIYQSMTQASPTLGSLTIMSANQLFGSRMPPLLDLALLPSLCELHIQACRYPQAEYGYPIPGCMFRFLRLSTNPSYIEQLTFNVDFDLGVQTSLEGCFDAEAWSQFDDILMNPKFLSLKLINLNFIFRLVGRGPAPDDEMEGHTELGRVRTLVDNLLPRIRESPGVALEVTINIYPTLGGHGDS